MSDDLYAKGVTADNLRILLAFWPQLMADGEQITQEIQNDLETLFSVDAEYVGWCYLYELPVKEHMALAMAINLQNLGDFLSTEQVVEWMSQLTNAPSQIGEIPKIHEHIGQHFTLAPAPTPTIAQKLEFQSSIAPLLGNVQSISNSLRCILYHGCFLNELIERVRSGDDAALFSAVRMDATVIGCPSVVQRISKASLLKDGKFFNKLKSAINGKQTKREQANFQMMRLVLEILHETGAGKLSDKQLHKLFIEELNLYSRDADPKALRKFANTYMKKKATT